MTCSVLSGLESSPVLVIDSYGGAFVNFRGPLLRDLVRRGHKVYAAAPDLGVELSAQLKEMGVEPLPVSIERGGVNPVRDLMGLWSLVRTIRRIRPTTLILYTPKAVIYGAMAGMLAGVPRRFAVITGLGYGFTATGFHGRLITLAQRILYRFSLPYCSAILFQNPDDRLLFKQLRLTGRSKLGLVNGSGVDLTFFSAAPVPSETVFLMVGRLLRSKGVREYLLAASMLRAEVPGLRFRLAGWLDKSNPDALSEEEFKGLLRESGVEYVGRLADVRPELQRCSVFVLPSYREGTPRSVLEALATGRAVITTDAPGCRETVIDGETGYLVPVSDARTLAEAMRRYAANPGLAATHGAAGRLLAEAKYDVLKVIRSLIEQLAL
jgi:glycosyltransferase involved in cell wall biosynthesis